MNFKKLLITVCLLVVTIFCQTQTIAISEENCAVSDDIKDPLIGWGDENTVCLYRGHSTFPFLQPGESANFTVDLSDYEDMDSSTSFKFGASNVVAGEESYLSVTLDLMAEKSRPATSYFSATSQAICILGDPTDVCSLYHCDPDADIWFFTVKNDGSQNVTSGDVYFGIFEDGLFCSLPEAIENAVTVWIIFLVVIAVVALCGCGLGIGLCVYCAMQG